MKKFIFAFVLMLLFCGCSNGDVTSQEIADVYSNDFSVSAKTVFDGNEAKMEIVKNPMSIGITFTYPEDLAGLKIEVFDEHARFIFEEMEQEIKTENIPGGAVFMLLDELFENLADPDDFAVSTEKENIKVVSDDFSAVLMRENLGIIRADFPENNTFFEFEGFLSGGEK